MQTTRRRTVWGGWAQLLGLTVVFVGAAVWMVLHVDSIETVIALMGGIGGAGAALSKAYERAATIRPPDLTTTDITAELARAQRTLWTGDLSRRQLLNDPMTVRWQAEPQAQKNRATIGGPRSLIPSRSPGLRLRGDQDDLLQLYRSLARGRLVISGGPGAGKTSVLLLLLLQAVSSTGSGDPVPVFLRLSGWRPERQDLIEFAVSSVTRDFPQFRNTENIKHLEDALESGQLSLFLDGLDQMDEADRRIAVQNLNEHNDLRVVLTSRPDELRAARTGPDRLAGAVVIELQPVVRAEARDFLLPVLEDASLVDALLRRLDELRATPGPDLHRPLYLSLLRDFNDRGQVAELLDPQRFTSADQLALQLIDRVIPHAYGTGRRRPRAGEPLLPISRVEAERWLSTIAGHMRGPDGDQDKTDLAWSEISAWAPVPMTRAVYSALAGLLLIGPTGIAVADTESGLPGWVPAAWGLAGTIAYALAATLDLRITGQPVVGMAIGIGGGTWSGLMIGLLLATESVHRSWLEPPAAALAGLGAGNLAALVLSLSLVAFGLRDPATAERRAWPSALSFGRPSWRISVGLALLALAFVGLSSQRGLTSWLLIGGAFAIAMLAQAIFSGQASAEAATSARRSLRSDVVAWTGVGLLIGLIVALLLGITFGSSWPGLLVWMLTALALTLLSSHTSGYLLAVAWFWGRGQLPRRPIRFLEDARRRNVMREVGWRFEFNHLLLLRRLGR